MGPEGSPSNSAVSRVCLPPWWVRGVPRWGSCPLLVSSGRWGGLLGTVHFRRWRKLARTGWRASVSRRVRTAGLDVEVGAGGERV